MPMPDWAAAVYGTTPDTRLLSKSEYVLLSLRDGKGHSHRQIAAGGAFSPADAVGRLSHLSRQGLVVRLSRGRYRITPAGLAALRALGLSDVAVQPPTDPLLASLAKLKEPLA